MAEAALSFLLILALMAIFVFFVYGFHQAPDSTTAAPDDHDAESGAAHCNPQGLDPTVVRALPVLKWAPGGPKGPCVVCLGEFEKEEKVKVIPGCGHVFHPGCIDEWLLLHGSCPICRCSHLLGAGVKLSGGGGAHHEEEEERGRRLRRSRSIGCAAAAAEGESSTSLHRTWSL